MTRYEEDAIQWAKEQSQALLERRFSDLDIEHLADEIMDVARAEERHFRALFGAFLRDAFAATKGTSNDAYRTKLCLVRYELASAPSLRIRLNDQSFIDWSWVAALVRLDDEPLDCPFSVDDVAAWLKEPMK